MISPPHMIHLLLTIRAPPHHIVGVIGESAPKVGRAVRELAGADYQAALEAERLRMGERIVAALISVKTSFFISDIRAEEARVAARIRVRAQRHNGVRQQAEDGYDLHEEQKEGAESPGDLFPQRFGAPHEDYGGHGVEARARDLNHGVDSEGEGLLAALCALGKRPAPRPGGAAVVSVPRRGAALASRVCWTSFHRGGGASDSVAWTRPPSVT